MNAQSWSVRGASVIGREHVRLGKNNQDGWAVASNSKTAVVVVTDGCSSETCSEVGARLAAKWLAAHAVEMQGALDVSFAETAVDSLTSWLYRMNTELNLLQECFLFTFLCAVARGEQCLVFGIGDGVIVVDEAVTRLDAGPRNAPAYCAYRLMSGERPSVHVHYIGSAKRILIATDGVERVSSSALLQLSEMPVIWKNPVGLQRTLNVLSAQERLFDDSTIGLLRSEGGLV